MRPVAKMDTNGKADAEPLIETRSFPDSLAATLAALPSISLIPVARLHEWRGFAKYCLFVESMETTVHFLLRRLRDEVLKNLRNFEPRITRMSRMFGKQWIGRQPSDQGGSC